MLALNHILAGAAIGSQTENIPVVVGLAIASHLAMDFLPHIDEGTEMTKGGLKPVTKYYLAAMDVFASIFIIVLVLMARPQLHKTPVAIGALAALFIDLVVAVPFYEPWVAKTRPFSYIYDFHDRIHMPLKRFKYSWGIPLQIVFVGICLWFLLK